MNEDTPGHVLIINNKDIKGIKPRHGTDEDAERLENLFSNRGFNVIVKKNLGAKVCIHLLLPDSANSETSLIWRKDIPVITC